ncbi:MAG TPA: AGE family epimerase/isomerase [Candidatus Aminicenantes bacterium]|nr:AGE family epimerase/isomerase [Candidatus Aminicenantes bacterium]
MERRAFLSGLALGSLSIPGLAAGRPAVIGKAKGEAVIVRAGASSRIPCSNGRKAVDKIGRYTLTELRDYFKKRLYGETIPFWDMHGVDEEYGGFLRVKKDGRSFFTMDKDLYSQGRILWIYSYLFNHFGQDAGHLEAARQGKEALVTHCRAEKGHWGTLYSRDWKLKKGFFDIYADIYMILGLAEYWKASGDEEALRLAVETSYLVTETVLAPHYQGQGHGPFYEPGIKRLGTWVHFLFPLTLLLSDAREEGLERIARMCVRNIIQRHWRRDQGFAYEYLDDRYEPYSHDYLSDYGGEHDYTRYISGWHSLQGAWKVMFEALRVGVPEMFADGLEFGLQTLRGHWNDGDDCRLMEYENPEMWARKAGNNLKPYFAIYDIFVFCLMAIEHAHEPEAMIWFDRAFTCALNKPGGIDDGDMTLHEPRGIMFSLEILERMIGRQGRASGVFDR